MTVATAFEVSWKPLHISKPSAINSATPRRAYGANDIAGAVDRSL
jgi:hypothetical protein